MGIYMSKVYKSSLTRKANIQRQRSDEELYDVPCLLESQQFKWDSTIHEALQDIFSSPGTNEY